MAEENEEDIMEENLSKIEPTQEEFINRRIAHLSFAKIVYWLCLQSKKSDFIYASELGNFMKFTQSRAYTILRDLCLSHILERNTKTSTLIEFRFVKNGDKPVIYKYLEQAKKTLNLD